MATCKTKMRFVWCIDFNRTINQPQVSLTVESVTTMFIRMAPVEYKKWEVKQSCSVYARWTWPGYSYNLETKTSHNMLVVVSWMAILKISCCVTLYEKHAFINFITVCKQLLFIIIICTCITVLVHFILQKTWLCCNNLSPVTWGWSWNC